jgi:ribonuclease VapC
MVVDTSAVIAFLRDEPEAGRIERAFAAASVVRLSALNAFECRVVARRQYGQAMLDGLETLLVKIGARIDAFDADQAVLAYDAYRRYGKGSGHAAKLNIGDCAAYALPNSTGLPLLFLGNDFARTDIEAAMKPARRA